MSVCAPARVAGRSKRKHSLSGEQSVRRHQSEINWTVFVFDGSN